MIASAEETTGYVEQFGSSPVLTISRRSLVRVHPYSQGPSTGHYMVSLREHKNARRNTVDKLL